MRLQKPFQRRGLAGDGLSAIMVQSTRGVSSLELYKLALNVNHSLPGTVKLKVGSKNQKKLGAAVPFRGGSPKLKL